MTLPREAPPLAFFLGGRDLEMLACREMLAAAAIAPSLVHDRSLLWGARASAYLPAITSAIRDGYTPVLIELEDDLPPEIDRSGLIIIDHHGPRAGADRPCSLRQLFDLLVSRGLNRASWTREHDLIAANDTGHIHGMLALSPPGSPEEILRIRQADRAAQGVTSTHDAQAAEAVQNRSQIGQLTLVTLPHDHHSAAADLFDPLPGGPKAQALLVRGPGKVSFYGPGSAVLALHKQFGGWYGGALPERGYWGMASPPEDIAAISSRVLDTG